MTEVSLIGVDLAKRVFQLHGAAADGSVVFRKKLSREKLLAFLEAQPRCVVAMEACATAHDWGRTIERLGHTVRLLPPVYVKPFVKRHKNDAADAEAITEAALRPTMRFVAVKSEDQQARAMIFRTRDLLVRQRTQLINALRGHLAEYGVVAPRGPAHVGQLAAVVDDEGSQLPGLVRELARLHLEQITTFNAKIADLDKTLREAAAAGTTTRRLQTMPGMGPITAMAIESFAPPMESFRRGRERRMAGPGTASAIDRRQSQARPDVEDGSARHPTPLDHRGHGGGEDRQSLPCGTRVVARTDAGEKAFEIMRVSQLGAELFEGDVEAITALFWRPSTASSRR